MKTKLISKLIAITIIATAIISCNKENKGYTINGTLNFKNNIDSVYIYQYDISGLGKTMNAAPIIDNKFTLKGKTDVTQKVIFGNVNSNFGTDLILENTNYEIEATEKTLKITGGEVHQKVLGFVSDPKYIEMVNNYNTKMEEIFSGVSMDDEKALNEARKKADNLGNVVIEYEEKIFDNIISNENEKTITKLMALTTSQDWQKYTKEKRIELLNKYEKELGNHINLNVHRDFLNAESEIYEMQETVKNGNPYKEISAKDIDGKTITLSELVKNNKYTLLEFWASWCSPCRAEIPNLKKAYQKYKDLGLEIYSVSIDAKKEDWEEALKEEKTTWPNSLLVGDEGKKQVSSYGVQGIPASFLIDKNGIIVASNQELREFELDRTLSKFLKK